MPKHRYRQSGRSEIHHGLQLTVYHPDYGAEHIRGWYKETLPVLIQRGEFVELRRGKITLKLRKPITYWVEDLCDVPPRYCAHADDPDLRVGTHRTTRKTVNGAIAALRHCLADFWSLDQYVEEKVIDKRLGREDVARLLKLATFVYWETMSDPWLIYSEVSVGSQRAQHF